MYPSRSDGVYGTFVKVFFENLHKVYPYTELIAIKGKRNGYRKLIQYIIFYVSIIYKLLIQKYDFVYIHTISHTSPPLRISNALRKQNLVFNIHGDDLITTTKLASKLRDLSLPLLRRAKLIFVPTTYFKNILLAKYPWIKQDNIFISPSGGLNKSFYNNSPKPVNKIPIIGYVSRIDKGKGWEYLIDALKELVKDGYKMKVYIVGSGYQENDLINKIDKENLSDTISYKGPLTHAELPNFYHSLDWFIFPTYRQGESLGLVGLEAMAGGTPVIGSDIAGLKSYIIDNNNGYLIPPQDSKALASKIKYAISLNKSEKELLSKNAYETALKYESSRVNEILFSKLKSIFQI